MNRISVGGLIYLLVGLFVANSQGYFGTIGTFGGLLSAILAVLLWPLVFLGANLHIAL